MVGPPELRVAKYGRVYYYQCVCDCGKYTTVLGGNLKSGNCTSCGCFRSERAALRMKKVVADHVVAHGEVRQVGGKRKASKEYTAWQSIKNRCLNPKSADYAYYGGRGIRMHPSWVESFENFLADLGRAPSPSHTVDRIDSNGAYEPGNCRWATRQTQARNRACTLDVTWCGLTKKTWDWAEYLGVSPKTIHHYLWQLKTGRMRESHIEKLIKRKYECFK